MNLQVIDWQNPLWMQTLQKLRHDVYHLPEYLYLEAKKNKTIPEALLIVDGDKIFFVPYLLRRCDDIIGQESKTKDIFDVLSPYGYSGILLSEAAANSPVFANFAINQLKYLLREKGVGSAFFRLHPILSHNFHTLFNTGTFTEIGTTVSVDLKLSDSQIWAHTRRGHQSTINKCKRLGFTARMVDSGQYINEFTEIYDETMNRVQAHKSYYFNHQYFADLLKIGKNLHLCIVELEDEIAAACLFFESCGIVQAHLGGTKTKFLHQSPFNLLLDYARYWAKERGNEFLHLGSGVGGVKDSLYHFKAGFSRQRHNWLKLGIITDEEKYNYLVELRAKSLRIEVEKLLQTSFFPAYRVPY